MRTWKAMSAQPAGAAATSPTASIPREVAAEQAHVDRAYARLEELVAEARELVEEARAGDRSGALFQRFERDAQEALGEERLRRLALGEQPLCFGRIDLRDGEALHIGRLGVLDDDGTALVVDWRAPIAERFYRATVGEPLDLVRRRHISGRGRRVLDLDDELLDAGAVEEAVARGELVLVGEAALLDALNRSRTGRMADIVATIQAEQDALVRSPLAGILVVQGGPGTGKTAIGLHRVAYLLYSHRLLLDRQGILLVGPNPTFLRYVEHVVPSLGETSLRLATPADLVPGVRARRPADDEPIAAIKADARMAAVLAAGVRLRQRPLRTAIEVPDGRRFLRLSPAVTRRVVERARASGLPHNQARPLVERLVSSALWTLRLQRQEREREAKGLPASEPAGSGGRAEPAGSGGRAEPAGSGGRAEAAGSGGRAEAAGSGGWADAGSGGWAEAAGSGGRAEAAGSGGRAEPPLDAAVAAIVGADTADGAAPASAAGELSADASRTPGRPPIEPGFRRRVLAEPVVREALDRMWPELAPARFLDDLLGTPALLRAAVVGVLKDDEANLLVGAAEHRGRSGDPCWASHDIALLDESTHLLGPVAQRARPAAPEEHRPGDELLVDTVLSKDAFGNIEGGVDPELRRILRDRLLAQSRADGDAPSAAPDPGAVAGVMGHVVVDEAQDLTPMQWRMLARRTSGSSLTLLGDLAQGTFAWSARSWTDVLGWLGRAADEATVVELSIGYRTPAEVLHVAEPVLHAIDPSLRPPRAVRSVTDRPRAVAGGLSALAGVVAAEREALVGGTVAVLCPPSLVGEAAAVLGVDPATGTDALERPVAVLPADGAKGLEFDAVVVLEPSLLRLPTLYVAITRTTRRLAIVHDAPLPPPLASGLSR